LDFLIEERENLLDYEQNWNQILKRINSEYPFQLNTRREASNDRLQFFINYNIIPEIRTIKELKIDILKDYIIPAFTAKRILWTYQEFNQEKARLNSYILESIASDKICRILDVDNEPRDIYDLWYVMKLKLNIPKIKEQVKNRLGYEISYPNLLNEITKEDFKINWRLRLEKQIGDLPSYDMVTEELEKSIEAKLLST
jgi:predicted nucleotidyltransferase component of viral defense system